MNLSSSIRFTRRAVTVVAVTLAGLTGVATPVLAAPISDGTSNTIQFAVTSVTLDKVHHRVIVTGPAQNRLEPGAHLVTTEIITPVATYTLTNTMVSGDTGTGLALNFTQINVNDVPMPCRAAADACLIESDGSYPPAP